MRVQVAPNKGASGSHPQATLDPEEEPVEEERGTRKLRWADCDDKEEEGWKKKVMWLDCSDGEQERQEETAKERGERCEVWKERVSGRVEVRSEENKEPEVMREKETGQEKTIDEKPLDLEDVENETKTQERWRLTRGPVAHTPRPRWIRRKNQ